MSVFDPESPGTYAFGPFSLVPERQALLRGDEAIRVGGRALDILTVLVEKAGNLVTKTELNQRVWPNQIVDEGNLKVNMAALRRALGEEPGQDRYIKTVPGRGYQFVAAVQASRAAAHRLLEAGNLPTNSTRIFGRDQEIETIAGELALNRLVSIVGGGGIGKTTVALAVAEKIAGNVKDGVWLVDFAPIRGPGLVANAIAVAIGLEVHSADVLATICKSVSDREMLLVLDNCEHLTQAVAECATQLLKDAPALKVLVTSREPLGAAGERVYCLPQLASPDVSSPLTAETAMRFPAIQLFVDRATDRMEAFTLNDAEAPVVADICRGLDGIALAIELAAMRIDVFGVVGLRTQLDDRFRLLAGRRGGLERHRTLGATLDWSYGLLSAREAETLLALSVFAGSFDVAAASAISSHPPSETAKMLSQLASKSLLVSDQAGKRTGYRFLETTRAYCRDRLHAGREEAIAQLRHATHVCDTLERGANEWMNMPAREWGEKFGNLIDDLRNALDFLGQRDEERALLVRLTVAGCLLWNHFSLVEECRIRVRRAIDELVNAGLAGTSLEVRLQFSLAAATMLTHGLTPEASAAADRALFVAVQTGDTDYRLRCLRLVGAFELWTGKHDSAIRTLATFSQLTPSEDVSALIEGSTHQAIGELFVGQLNTAKARLQELKLDLPDFEDSQFVRFLDSKHVNVMNVLSHVEWITGSPETAEQIAMRAVEYGRESRHAISYSHALAFATPVLFWNGQYTKAAEHLAIFREHLMRHGIAVWRPVARFYDGAITCSHGEVSESGLHDIEQAILELRSLNHFVRMPYYLGVHAYFRAAAGDHEMASFIMKEALECSRIQNERWCLPEILRFNASIVYRQGLTDAAEHFLHASLAAAAEINARSWQLRTSNDLARLLISRSQREAARQVLNPIYETFTEGYQTRDVSEAAAILAAA
ncbi:ATP-binding protein [Rhizobium sp. SL42]|uniref:ATP-binding protein n=1 Tax=Rhizobium sp. SL42 TaxID=2806346 RepID=UPI001F46FFC8|nr:winged helix-turn-helix domain-containing protein [Rhizobium sp. SL42]UJW77168.1 helix-turn-helix transcriptional regulator [Rhizobium sp. SL42]